MINLDKETSLFCHYLVNKKASTEVKERYKEAIDFLHLSLTKNEVKIISSLHKYPFLIPFVDGGLALSNRQSGIRNRLLTLSALLETDTNYTDAFLTLNEIKFPIFRFMYLGSKAVLTGVIGLIFLKLLRWN